MQKINTKHAPWNQPQNRMDLYRGIRDQDGFETLELTVRAEHPPAKAAKILEQLRDELPG